MKLKTLALGLAAGMWLCVGSALADNARNPFRQECGSHASPKAFVKAASYYCVRQDNATRCREAAEAYFEMCGYNGDFQRLSREAYTGMLFMFVVAKAPQVADTVPAR